jgi:uncharacterized membrane protein YbhN (UPF0104 family)
VPGRPSRLPGTLSWAGSVLMLVIAAWLLHHYLSDLRWRDVVAALQQLPARRIAGSLAATAVSFTMLATFDVLAARTAVPGRVGAGLSALAGVLAHALSNTLGFHAFTGGAVRYRIYATAGLGASDVVRIVSLASLGVGFGYAVLGIVALWLEPAITRGWGHLASIALLTLLGGLLLWLGRRPRTLRVHRWTLALPGVRITAMQMLIGGIEMSAAVGAMYVLLPAAVAPAFVDFVPIYLVAVLAGIISHAPGGLGVFEAILLSAFPSSARADVLAALLCYRLVYNLLPFGLAAGTLLIFETRRRLQAGPA